MQKYIAILFGAAIALIILHSYTAYVSAVLILPVLLCTYAVYRFCEYCYGKKQRLRFLLVFSLVLLWAFWLVFLSSYDISFFDWLYYNFSTLDYFLYFSAMFMVCCFLTACAVFYFTAVVYRALFLFIIMLIPFGLNFTRYIDVPALYTLTAIGLYFALLLTMGKTELKNTNIRVNLRYIFIPIAALCLLTALTFTVKLPENARPTGWGGGSNAGNDSESSGLSRLGLTGLHRYSGTAGFDRSNDEVLFMVEADEQLYFIRQVFTTFNGTQWEFDWDHALNAGTTYWEGAAKALNYDILFSSIRNIDMTNARHMAPLNNRDIIGNLRDIEQVRTATIIPVDLLSTTYLLAPPRAFAFDILQLESIYSQFFGEITHMRNPLGMISVAYRGRIYNPYTITYYRDSFRDNRHFQRLSRQPVNDYDELFYNLLDYAFNDYIDNPEFYAAVTSLRADYINARNIKAASDSYQTPRIRMLVTEITAGMDSDYEKAEAIERYFLDGGFEYDTDNSFIDANRNIEHFIFESRTGTCGHFATAMTIMARIAGLNARYVEGFTSTEVNDLGYYEIRGRDSHAFVQVYMPFYGWVVFDPTVPAPDIGIPDDNGLINTLVVNSFAIFTTLSVLILAGVGGYFLYIHIIVEFFFRFKATRTSGRKGILLIYFHILKLARKKLGLRNVSSAELTQAIHDKYGLDIEPITSSFCKAFYGNELISIEEKDIAYDIYEQLYKHMHGKKGKADAGYKDAGI